MFRQLTMATLPIITNCLELPGIFWKWTVCTSAAWLCQFGAGEKGVQAKLEPSHFLGGLCWQRTTRWRILGHWYWSAWLVGNPFAERQGVRVHFCTQGLFGLTEASSKGMASSSQCIATWNKCSTTRNIEATGSRGLPHTWALFERNFYWANALVTPTLLWFQGPKRVLVRFERKRSRNLRHAHSSPFQP